MTQQNQLTQERVNEVVLRIRNILQHTTSADPRVSLLLTAYRKFSNDHSVINFNYLLHILIDTEQRIFDPEQT